MGVECVRGFSPNPFSSFGAEGAPPLRVPGCGLGTGAA